MKQREYLGRWRKPEAEQRFRAIEDELWDELVPDRPPEIHVETGVGTTCAYHWPGAGPPIVLLHGVGGSSLMWAQYVGVLVGDVYAVDTMGDAGRSVQRVAFRDRAHQSEWLGETLEGLGLERAHLVGASYGGGLALNQALRRPEQVASITLLDPVSLADIRMAHFIFWGMAAFGGSLGPRRVRRQVAKWTRMPLVEEPRIMRLSLYGQINHPVRVVPPETLTDDQLRSIDTPALVLLGEKTVIYRAEEAAVRARSMPDARVEIVPDAGHALPVSHFDLVLDRIRGFLPAPAA